MADRVLAHGGERQASPLAQGLALAGRLEVLGGSVGTAGRNVVERNRLEDWTCRLKVEVRGWDNFITEELGDDICSSDGHEGYVAMKQETAEG